MHRRDNESERAAGSHIVGVLGGSYEINDTGAEPGQYDLRIDTEDGRSIAVEVTSFGGDDWKRTPARIRAEQEKGRLRGERLQQQWWVVIPTGISVRELDPGLEELLVRLEGDGRHEATSRYDGPDEALRQIAKELQALRVNFVSVWAARPSPGQPQMLIAQSESRIGTSGALPAALEAVFTKRDNQAKLARAEAVERHLYVFMEHAGAEAVLEGEWPLPPCPADPAGVIDIVWLYSPSSSWLLFRARPGTDEWTKFSLATGGPV